MIFHHHFLHWFNFLTVTSLHTIIITITTTATPNPSLTLSKGGRHAMGRVRAATTHMPSPLGKAGFCVAPPPPTHLPYIGILKSIYSYIYICGFMYICNIYIHIHLYYITFTNIFFFKNTHFLPPAFLQKLVTNIT